MRNWLLIAALLVLSSGCSKQQAPPVPTATYIDSRSCAGCHAAIAKTYRETGMAQAFGRATPALMHEKGMLGRFDHAASGRSYEVIERGGRFFATRHAKGFGADDHAIEREIHYVMGSGRHARTFIHRTPQGRLTQLPLGWYAEKGGSLAMSPGYDRPAPLDFRRKISFDCMFCHNGYPAVPAGSDAPSIEPIFPASLPEGIDCQRCHGPGSLHVAAAGRGPIVNPAKLPTNRAMEICMQCHLETTSFPLPNSMVKLGRGAFSYRPGEPLGDFTLHFDHAPGTGHEDKFEIVNSAYRLRQSKCFLASAGKLSCTTCHNPHDVPRGSAARVSYDKACRSCHQQLTAPTHTANVDCATCHMPKRRTEDVIHAVMTDHKIVRRPPPGNLLAPRSEIAGNDYSGEVVLYYPAADQEQDLYLALAQVIQKSNLEGGVPRLEAAIRALHPKQGRVYFTLAQAYERQGKRALAETQYREAFAQEPNFVPALWKLAELLHRQGRTNEALPLLERARAANPSEAGVRYALGLVYRDLGRTSEAVSEMEAAIAADADFPDAHNSLGGILMETGNRDRARAAFLEALRQQPDLAEAQGNFGHSLAIAGDYPRAEHHLLESIRLKPDGLSVWQALGDVQSARGAWAQAKKSYAQVLRARPDDQAANLGLGTAQAATGEVAAAKATLQRAAAGSNPAIRQEAVELLNQIR